MSSKARKRRESKNHKKETAAIDELFHDLAKALLQTLPKEQQKEIIAKAEASLPPEQR